jgi:hypothetical protein
MGTPFWQPKEFVNCGKCGVEFQRTARKGVRKKLCERCQGNERYKKTKRRSK